MNGDLVALAVGTILAVGALAFVLYPLFFSPSASGSPPPRAPDGELGPDSAIVALREIEFDRATGKLSERDYGELRAQYAAQAIREMRATEAPADDVIEARVRAYRAARRECPTCGLRPEPDAIYCSTCGGYLAGQCPACNEPIRESSAGFCAACGATLREGAGAPA